MFCTMIVLNNIMEKERVVAFQISTPKNSAEFDFLVRFAQLVLSFESSGGVSVDSGRRGRMNLDGAGTSSGGQRKALDIEEGCDASVLLDDSSSITGEKTAGPNNNSLRGFDVVDKIKTQVEKACPGVVSCADILTIAARDSVEILGGPSWSVKLGRRDSKTASLAAANTNGVLPAPTSDLSDLISSFNAQGLSTTDMVALSGAHTIGKARCTSFRTHIYNETNIDASFAKTRQNNCPFGSGDNNLAPLDTQTTNAFDPKYFQNLINKKGLLHSDQELFNGGSTDSLVKTYSASAKTFHADFVKAMIKMGDIKLLTGSKGEIRKNCRKPN